MNKRLPTPSQAEYLRRALEIHKTGRLLRKNDWAGIHFDIHVPSHTSSGAACLSRGWIDGLYVRDDRVAGPYHLTYEGIDALQRYEMANQKKRTRC